MNTKFKLLIFNLVFFLNCSSPDLSLEGLVNQISINSESKYLIANNISTVHIKKETNLKQSETNQLDVKYFANGILINDDFKTNIAGNYTIWAEVNSLKSNEIILIARPPEEYIPIEFTVVFHIINSNIQSNDIIKVIEQLNKTYRTPLPNLDPNAVDTFIQFKLAENDPNGNMLEEKGITRHQLNPEYTINFEDWMWDIYWDPDYYINIWVGDTGSTFSHGSYPVTECDSTVIGISCEESDDVNYLHGIAMRSAHIRHNANNVISHEMGHFFGLQHAFNNNCYLDSDFCLDTQNYNREYYESHPIGSFRAACDGMKFRSWNIMDYYDQDIRFSITYDQRKRLRTIIESSKWSALLGSQNINTGRFQMQKDIKKPKNYKLNRKNIFN